jgi:dTDP-glucose 4,6-dehydratase
MSNYLITGGCGFIGYNFINYIKSDKNIKTIVNIDKLNYCSNNVNFENDKNIKFIKSDLKNKKLLLDLLEKYQIDKVIHFAAQTSVDNSFNNSTDFILDNVNATHNLLEACKIYNKLSLFLFISTDEVYGEVFDMQESRNEESYLNPTNPYAASKLSAEYIVKSYYHTYKLPIIITRLNNVYGKMQYPEKIIPKFITLLKNNQKITIHGNGINKRNYVYIDDICNGIKLIIEKGEINNIYNIGSTENTYTNIEIAKKIIEIMKPEENYNDWIEFVKDRLYNDYYYKIDSRKIKALGWYEKTNFNVKIPEIIKWYEEN